MAEESAVDVHLAAFSRERAADLTGVSLRRLDSWARQGFVVPSIQNDRVHGRAPRLYDFGDAMSLLIVQELLSKKISARYIRDILEYLRRRDFQPHEVKFAIAGSRVHFQTPDGVWEDTKEPGQVVLHQVLNLKPLEARLRRSLRRPKDAAGRVERKRGRLGSKPVLAGTRVPVSGVAAYLERGYPDEVILAAYPALSRRDIDYVRSHAATA